MEAQRKKELFKFGIEMVEKAAAYQGEVPTKENFEELLLLGIKLRDKFYNVFMNDVEGRKKIIKHYFKKAYFEVNKKKMLKAATDEALKSITKDSKEYWDLSNKN